MFVSLVSSSPSLPLLYVIDKVKGRLLRFVFLDAAQGSYCVSDVTAVQLVFVFNLFAAVGSTWNFSRTLFGEMAPNGSVLF